MPRRTLPRDRYPRLCEALALSCSLHRDEAESVLMHAQDVRTRNVWSPLLAHMYRFNVRTPEAAVRYAVELRRGGVLVAEIDRQRRRSGNPFRSPSETQRVLWGGVKTCVAGQADLFE